MLKYKIYNTNQMKIIKKDYKCFILKDIYTEKS